MCNVSIKKQIILAFSGIYLLVNLLLLLFNHTFSDDFFIANNFHNMERQVEGKIHEYSIESYEEYDVSRVEDELKKLTGSDVFILKSDLSYGKLPKSQEEQLTYVLYNYNYLFDSAGTSLQPVTAVIGDGNYINRKLVYIEILPTNDVVVFIKGLGLIMEAQELFIKFLAFSSLVVYGVSIILVVIFAYRFTKPIKKVEKTALKISHLNFEHTLDENRGDEIGSLNKHINTMASTLSATILELNDSNRKLTIELNKEKNMEAMREQFVSDVSHELKNPISMVIGYAEGIQRGLAKTEEDKAFYNKVILEEGKRMNKLVEELLDLSSYKSGSITLEKEVVKLDELLIQAINKYKMIQIEKRIVVNLDINKDVQIKVDAVRIGQVINNVLHNAFKYTNEDGEIKVTLVKDEKPILTIANTGDLIPENEFENIWNSFYQVETDKEGSGIGLAIVKSIVELHGFSIKGFTDKGMNQFRIEF